MVIGWIVSIALLAVCGLVALAVVKIIDYLDLTTSIGEDLEAESHPLHDDQARQHLPGDATIGIALPGAIESNELDTPPVSIEQPDATQPITSRLDARSDAANEGETPADR